MDEITPGIYKHFKRGDLYLVFGVSTHTETSKQFVSYMALYGNHSLWSRPLSMFLETATKDGQQAKRFELITQIPNLLQRLASSIKNFPLPEH